MTAATCLGLPVLYQPCLDSDLVLSGDAGTSAGSCPAAPGLALGPFGLIAPVHTVAPQLPADRAGRAIELMTNAAQRAASVTQGTDLVSFEPVSGGHGP